MLTGISSSTEIIDCDLAQKIESSRFSNGETGVTITSSVRDNDVYIIQTACEPVNDLLMELLIAISACKMASARRITAVLPCYPYSRQDKKDRSRAPITAKLVANMLEVAGCSHVILYAERSMVEFISSRYRTSNLVIVSPDAGGARRAAAIAEKLQVELAIIHKERKVANQVSRMVLVGDVKGRDAVIVDDIADTCGTLALASKVLLEHGATSRTAIVTHGFLSGPSVEVVEESCLDSLVVSNTLPLPAHAKRCQKIQQMDISHVFAEAIRRTYHGESISVLFK
ncbi:ribose-phosphate pyrophosphokinase 3 [Fusarium mexicanum]|uniref:ribose-phosphate diphosphokinase n=1 Tax=Fusarium mexicanum TaxID=751941 RepID=A0A8H5IVI3_9HYPO|nr:ribose-phosphate pyrophosphokinase 3 [Fusarium mexicanum]